MTRDPLKDRLFGMIVRGVIEAVNDDTMLQSLQVSMREGELADDVERFQNYGITSRPFADAEAVVVMVGGVHSHCVVLAVDDRRYRIKTLEEGEVALYDDQGQIIHLKRDGIVIESPLKVTVKAPDVVVEADTVSVTADTATLTSDTLNLGGEGGPAVARVGDDVVGGKIVTGSSKV